ncbi:hypothetical protein QSV08_14895 [Maribacter sp. BPC-D8]|uniref:hypothetical protein n=1 Tax=Maribacter sp. BPC-D8 TaxID=3053613 RepID=UPI002B48414A|nr:hypothetical protein [Maribacter sp. BPC-D8]WRI28503.1 hypothetical protein QSV08_14895 [Maribacter sp. BPC-D8]
MGIKKIYCFLITIIFLSCTSQDSIKSKIQGNWYLTYESVSDHYGEFFIDSNRICYYHEFKEKYECNGYIIKENKLYLKRKTKNDSLDYMGLISIKNNLLVIDNTDGGGKFSKQLLKPNLEDLIHQKIKLSVFYEGYTIRAANWEESKLKSLNQ